MDSAPSSCVSFHVEENPVSIIRNEGMHLLAQHWREVAIDQDAQVLDPDWPEYEMLERANRIWMLTVRDQGCLVGYIVMLLTRNKHYRKLTMAIDDIHFLHPEYRRGLIGYRMFRITEKAMAARGIRKCVLRTKFLLDHGKLFERLGFVKEDIVYSKILGS